MSSLGAYTARKTYSKILKSMLEDVEMVWSDSFSLLFRKYFCYKVKLRLFILLGMRILLI